MRSHKVRDLNLIPKDRTIINKKTMIMMVAENMMIIKERENTTEGTGAMITKAMIVMIVAVEIIIVARIVTIIRRGLRGLSLILTQTLESSTSMTHVSTRESFAKRSLHMSLRYIYSLIATNPMKKKELILSQVSPEL